METFAWCMSQPHAQENRSFLWWSRPEFLGRRVCRTKLPPKNSWIDMKNGLTNAKKDPKNDPKRVWKMFSPSQAAKKYFTCTFHQNFKSFSPPKICQKNKKFFTARLCRGSQKVGFGKRGLLENAHFLEILENLEILEILENPRTVENKGKSDHFLEILENLEILEILEIFSVKRPLS